MIIPPQISLTNEGQYCFACYSQDIARVIEVQRTLYYCRRCNTTSERSLVIDNSIQWWVDAAGNYWHESVGTMIVNERGELLTIMRSLFPFAYALPAGHLDRNEEPRIGARREVLEEVGLDLPIAALRLVDVFPMEGDSCRRGCDHHLWHLFLARVTTHDQPIRLNDEASECRWQFPSDILNDSQASHALRLIAQNYSQMPV